MLPKAPDVVREAVVVLAGAVLAAFIIGQFPGVKAWMRQQWEGSRP